MENLIKFVHIISAMVYFGLPFTFGRWYSSATVTGNGDHLVVVVGKMLNFVRIHLLASALLVLGTGVYLAFVRGWWHGAWWPHLAVLLLLLSLANLFLGLQPALRRLRGIGDTAHPLVAATRIRIAIFSATHHTLVTLITLLMVFRNQL